MEIYNQQHAVDFIRIGAMKPTKIWGYTDIQPHGY
jgi:hypothetical protein